MKTGPKPRLRNLIGMIGLVIGLIVYAWLIMRLALAIDEMPWAVEVLLYGTAGIIWIWPAKWLIAWGQSAGAEARDHREADKDGEQSGTS